MSEWLRSSRARTLFRYSSWVVVCIGLIFAFMQTPWFQQIESMPTGDVTLRVLLAPIAFTAVPACLIILIGMAIFCAREDRSRFSVKLVWFALFLITGPFASAAYYFLVYRKRAGGADIDS